MAIKGFFELTYSVVTEKRRNFVQGKIDAALKSAGGLNDAGQATTFDVIDLVAGEWVQLNASEKLIKADGSVLLAWPVYTGGDRHDVSSAGITVLQGNLVARTSLFDPGQVYAANTELTIADLAGQAVLTPAASTDPVVAHAEGAPQAHASFPDGLLPINTTNAGYFKP